MSQEEDVVEAAQEQVSSETLGRVDLRIEYEGGIAKGLTWTWDPPEANVALVLREALDPLLEAQNDKLGRDFRRERRLSNYTAADFVAPEVTSDQENDSLNGSAGSDNTPDS